MAILILDENNLNIVNKNQIIVKADIIGSRVIKKYKNIDRDIVNVVIKLPRDFESAFDILVKFNNNGRETLLFEKINDESIKNCIRLRNRYLS